MTLYYRYRTTNESSWSSNLSYDVVITPWVSCSWSFSFPNGSGNYQFYCIAKDNATNAESAPSSADTECGFDTQAPTSSVNVISPYWEKDSTSISATATDPLSGVKNVTLYYRFSSDNGSWGAWLSVGVDIVSPWSWDFTFSNASGYYQFYSIAIDYMSNPEVASGGADAWCGFDNGEPTSSVNEISPYWLNRTTTITATANDGLSGVRNITLYYRFGTNNLSWGGWVSGGIDTASPWAWNFSFSNDSGYYQFYSSAQDHSMNTEVDPGIADAWSGYDTQRPSSSVNTITGYWITSSPLVLTSSVSDPGLSGLKNVTLFYRYRTANSSSWGSDIRFGVDYDPWDTCSWSFTFPNGAGHYQFFSIAADNATNTEMAPGGSGDTTCGFNTGTPISFVNEIRPYWSSSEPLIIYANAEDVGPSGLKNVTLYYYNSTDNMSWMGPWQYGIDYDPWIECRWSFMFLNQTGFYRFYSRAADNSSNVEDAPLSNDTGCGYDTQSPTCVITYNGSNQYYKADDLLRIYVNFMEPYSGMNESSILIAISTLGDGSLLNTSMHRFDNTHWYYDWSLPSGSDEDGPFTVCIFAEDNVSDQLIPSPTIDASKQIDNTLPVISSLSAGSISQTSAKISWMTNENTTSCVEYGRTSTYDSWLNRSEYVVSHECFLSGLSPDTIYYYKVISADFAGNQNTSSSEIFLTNRQSPRNIIQIFVNTPPSNPTIDGPITGHLSVTYPITVRSLDRNNNTIRYTFDWGDGTKESSGFLPNGVACVKNHSWRNAGKYVLRVTASDNQTNASSEKIIWIDALEVGDLGYLIDNDSDGTYDSFRFNPTGRITLSEIKNGKYLIDADGDNIMDYQYDPMSGTIISIHQPPTLTEEKPFSPFLLIGGLILIIVIIATIVISRRRFSKK